MTSKIIMVPSMLSFMGGKLMTYGGSCQIVPNLVPVCSTVEYTTMEGDYQVTKTAYVGPTVRFDENSQGSLHIDPLYDYFGWYGFDEKKKWDNMHCINTAHLENLMVTMREISVEIEKKIQDLVLVQSMGHQSWNMFFSNAEDKQTMADILAQYKPVLIHLTVFPKDMERAEWPKLMEEMTDWCDTTLADKFILTQSFRNVTGKFKNDSDAALFKLKWTYA